MQQVRTDGCGKQQHQLPAVAPTRGQHGRGGGGLRGGVSSALVSQLSKGRCSGVRGLPRCPWRLSGCLAGRIHLLGGIGGAGPNVAPAPAAPLATHPSDCRGLTLTVPITFSFFLSCIDQKPCRNHPGPPSAEPTRYGARGLPQQAGVRVCCSLGRSMLRPAPPRPQARKASVGIGACGPSPSPTRPCMVCRRRWTLELAPATGCLRAHLTPARQSGGRRSLRCSLI